MADSSAIDDTAAEARDLLLGDAATHVLDDVNGRIHAAVSGFHETFLSSEGSDARNHQSWAQKSLEAQPSELWQDPAARFVRKAFVDETYSRLKDIPEACGKKYVGRDDSRLETMDFQGKPDLVLVPALRSPRVASRPIWYHAQALVSIREASSGGYQQAFLQLCGQAQSVFQHQPTRRFLHAVSVYGFTLEFLILDRAGVISSEPIDLREGYERLLEVLCKYASMDDDQLGLGTYIAQVGADEYVQLPAVDRDGLETFDLGMDILAWPDRLLTLPGAYCKPACREDTGCEDVVVKLIWESPMADRREIDMLKHATRCGVWGVPQVLGQKTFTSTSHIRKNLDLGCRRRIPPQSIQRPSLGEQMLAAMDEPTTTEAEERFEVHHNCLRSNTVVEDSSSTQDDVAASHKSDEFVLNCIATLPRGRPLASFKCVSEALYALRDAVKAHRSLYEDAKLLHCDISRNNIIIPDPLSSRAQSPRGILIDFDECVDLNSQAPPSSYPDAPRMVEIRGTRAFMAIDLMRGSSHTYRHDLESFLYVFLHIAISYHSPDPPMTSRLNAWQTLDPWPELAAKKLAMIEDEKTWRALTDEFTPSWEKFVWLADELRTILFRIGEGREGEIFLGTEEGEEEREDLYNKVIGAFDKAIPVPDQS
jgi:hypothetical protein